MMSKRAPLALVLCAVLFVTSGFAATKKIQRHDGSRDWNDLSLQNDLSPQNGLSLQNGSLPDAGSSVSGVSSGFQSSGALGRSGSPNPDPVSVSDNWNGGTGNWSNGANWSTGSSPGGTSIVKIYSGGNDNVTLDVSATINSLTLGGAGNYSTFSELTDGGVAQTLTITNELTIGTRGGLYLYGGSTVSAGADSSNAGSVELDNGSTLKVAGNFDNAGTIETGYYPGGNTLTITGTLTNQGGGQFILGFPARGDKANIGGLANSGLVDVEDGGTLTINGNVTNSGFLFTQHYDPGGGNTGDHHPVP